MPIYEYKCTQCEHELEKLQKISEPLLTDCPECGKPALKKKISAAGFRLKGNGWYETDFKNSGQKKTSDSGKGDSSKSDSSKAGNGKSGDTPSGSTGSTSSKKTAVS